MKLFPLLRRLFPTRVLPTPRRHGRMLALALCLVGAAACDMPLAPDASPDTHPMLQRTNDNQPPAVDIGGPYSGVAGVPIQFDASKTVDPEGDYLYYYWVFGDSTAYVTDTVPTISYAYRAPGSYTVQLWVADHYDEHVANWGYGRITVEITAPGVTTTGDNVEVVPSDPATGEAVTSVGLTFDNVSGAGTTTVTSATLSDQVPVPSGFRVDQSSTYYDIKTDASFTGEVTVCIGYTAANYDDEGQVRLLHYDTDTGQWEDITTSVDPATNTVCGRTTSFSPFLVAERNAAPRVTGIALSSDPFAVGTAVRLSASFRDANPGDTHVATIAWGDGTSSNGVVSGGTVTGSRSYSAAGVYTVIVTVRDNYRGAGTARHEYVVVYDPSAGFVTGGGWIMSPAGAYAADASASGKATFGFVSHYQKGATTPSGTTQFQFHAGNLDFRSTAYEWLVISGPKAQYKGRGTINGTGDFGFILTVNDGQVRGGGGTDRFRLKITDRATNRVVYDNQWGEADDANATTELGGGSIVIHGK